MGENREEDGSCKHCGFIHCCCEEIGEDRWQEEQAADLKVRAGED